MNQTTFRLRLYPQWDWGKMNCFAFRLGQKIKKNRLYFIVLKFICIVCVYIENIIFKLKCTYLDYYNIMSSIHILYLNGRMFSLSRVI